MAVAENGSSSAAHLETKTAPSSHVDGDLENSNPSHFDTKSGTNKDDNGCDSESTRKSDDSPKLSDQSLNLKSQSLHDNSQLNGGVDDTDHAENGGINHENSGTKDNGSYVQKDCEVLTKSDDSSEAVDDVNDDLADPSKGDDYRRNGEKGDDDGLKKNIRDLKEMLSKLNPMAAEFVPSSIGKVPSPRAIDDVGFGNNFLIPTNGGNGNGFAGRRKKSNYGQGKRRMNARTSMAQREEVIRRTVYVSDIDHQVTEEQLAALFINCGQVVDCRVCGDPNSVLRFAFIEFTDEEGARNALSLSGTMLGFYPVRVLPSKTAIAPVNPTFLPRSEDEREMCARTVYCTNIDKKVTQADVKMFFESLCGKVHRLRLLGDYHHSTRIAFVEFVMAESAIAALSCSGAVLGTLPIRVSPSKTPVRPRPPRPLH